MVIGSVLKYVGVIVQRRIFVNVADRVRRLLTRRHREQQRRTLEKKARKGEIEKVKAKKEREYGVAREVYDCSDDFANNLHNPVWNFR